MSETTEAKYAHQWAPEPTLGDPPADHATHNVMRAVGFAKGWLDRDLWADGDGRTRANQLLTVIAQVELSRLWVAIRDGEDLQDVADWMDRLEDPDCWLEWLGDQAGALGVEWDQVLPYGGDNWDVPDPAQPVRIQAGDLTARHALGKEWRGAGDDWQPIVDILWSHREPDVIWLGDYRLGLYDVIEVREAGR